MGKADDEQDGASAPNYRVLNGKADDEQDGASAPTQHPRSPRPYTRGI